MSHLTLFTLPPSPYNTKVRLALKLKGLSFDVKEVGFEDREEVVQASGQPLTPVLVDGDRAIYDSFAILRYLDANFPGLKLFRADRDEQRKIQDWEQFGRELGAPLRLILIQALNQEIDDEATQSAQKMMLELPQRIEAALAQQDYLLGEEISAADLSVAPFLQFALATPEECPEGILRFIAERFEIPIEFPRTRDWVARVLALDTIAVH